MKRRKDRIADERLTVDRGRHVAVEARQSTVIARDIRNAVDRLDIKIIIVAESELTVALREELALIASCNEIGRRHCPQDRVPLLHTDRGPGIGERLFWCIDSVARSSISMDTPKQ